MLSELTHPVSTVKLPIIYC